MQACPPPYAALKNYLTNPRGLKLLSQLLTSASLALEAALHFWLPLLLLLLQLQRARLLGVLTESLSGLFW